MAILLSRDGTEVKGAGNVDELSAENKKITNLAAPTADTDAATKEYVDNASGSAANALDGTFTIDNTVDPTKQIAFDASDIATGTKRTIAMPDEDVDLGLISSAIQSSEKGAANGVAPLNALSKIDATYLPSYVDDVEEYADFASLPVEGETGKIYVTLDDNNCFRWSGSAYIEISPNAITSVNGQTGIVELDSDDIDEGSTNLYFTDARAKAAAVADAIVDGVADIAPSQNAVFDALALKADQDDLEALDDEIASVRNRVVDLEEISGRVFDEGFAGEALEANVIHLVRRAKVGEVASRYYKAQADSFENSRVVGFVLLTEAVAASSSIRVYKLGECPLGEDDDELLGTDLNVPLYLHQSAPGKFTTTPSEAVGAILKPVGYVATTFTIEFQPGLAIQA